MYEHAYTVEFVPTFPGMKHGHPSLLEDALEQSMLGNSLDAILHEEYLLGRRPARNDIHALRFVQSIFLLSGRELVLSYADLISLSSLLSRISLRKEEQNH